MNRYVILVNSGCVTDYRSYVVFLYRMFTDPVIIDLPKLPRYLIASLIATIRPVFGYYRYKRMGQNPLLYIMKLQAQRTEDLLKDYSIKVLYANLYSEPFFEKVLEELPRDAKIAIIPQFPQYSKVTTGSIEWRMKRFKDRDIKLVKGYCKEELFVRMWKEKIEGDYEGEHIVFVAHSVPEKLVDAGDPYVDEVMESGRLIAKALGTDNYSFGFSSAFPLGRWVGPSVESALLAAIKNFRRVMVVPISFVNEHLETIYDLDISLREFAVSNGAIVYKRVKVPYDSKHLFELYRKLALEVLDV